METLIIGLAVLAGVLGVIGSILPALPGTPVSWAGMLLLFLWGGEGCTRGDMTLQSLLIWLGIVIVVSILDYVIPLYFTKLTGGSPHAGRGAMAGLILGILIPPIGMIIGAFVGAFLVELYYTDKSKPQALKAALGSFLGFLFGTGLKIITSCVMFWYIIKYI